MRVGIWGEFLMVLMVKNPPPSTGDSRDTGSIPGLGRSPEQEVAIHSKILAWKIPWTEDLAGCSPWGHREFDTTE